MRYLYSFLIIGLIYSSVVGIGIFVGIDMIEKIEKEEVPPLFEEPESLTSSVQVFLYILFVTALLLLLIKYKFDILIKIMLVMAMLVGMVITFQTLLGIYFALIPAVGFVMLNFLRKSIMLRNLTLVFAISGVGAILGASLGVIPALVLLIVLSAYDVLAVFGTKHMVTLADALQPKPKHSAHQMTKHTPTPAEEGGGGFPFMFTLPFGDHDIELGTGDFAIPCMFAVSVLRDHPWTELHAVVTAIGGLVGVMALFIYIMKKEHIALPALPPISAGLILGFGLSLLIF